MKNYIATLHFFHVMLLLYVAGVLINLYCKAVYMKTLTGRNILFVALLFVKLNSYSQIIDSTTILFNIDTVCKNLGYPWEITYGYDDSLWITEARGYRVLRISPTRNNANKNVAAQQVLRIPLGGSMVSFSRSIGTWPQGGMQGLVLHPEFNAGKQWVYISYIYSGNCPAGPSSPCYFRTKIVRCRFYFQGEAGSPNITKDTLAILDTVISNLPGSNDHNSGRMTISPVTETDGTYKLYYTIGDMGAGQFNNATRTNRAQTVDTTEGKILRLNTEPDVDGDPITPIHDYDQWRKWIPNDNPFFHSIAMFSSLKTPVYSYGHRNAQGLAWGNVNGTWRLYSSEHGDKSDDEVNNIIAGGNYGWPKAAGLCDDNYNTTDAFTNNDRLAGALVTNEAATFCNVNTNQRSLFSFFNWTGSQLQSINNGNIFTWPTIAPSSIDFYNGNIPGWRNSLLVTSLKYGLFRLKLKSTGDYVDSSSTTNTVDTLPLLHGWRIRDIAIDPNPISGKFWVVVDSTGSTSGPTGGFSGSSSATKDGGKVLMLSYKTLLTLALNDNPLLYPPVDSAQVNVYPNPAHDIIGVHIKKGTKPPVLLQLLDLNGRILHTVQSTKSDFYIDIKSLLPGTYIVSLFNGNNMKILVKKIVKQ